MRRLSAEETELWERVTATIRPLSRSPESAPPIALPDSPAAGPPKPKPTSVASTLPRQPVGPGRTLDGSWDRRLRSGVIRPDRIVDLHGLNLDQAWRAIDVALEQAIEARDRVVLLITGHERPGDPPIERGRIRAAVHDWLAVSRHAPRIAAVRGAHGRHGGGGSLYLVLRAR